MGGARVRLVEGFEVDHLLIGPGRFRETALLHQGVAKQPVIEHELTRRDQPARDRPPPP